GLEPYGYWIAEEKQPGYGLPIVLCTSKYEAGDPVNWVAQQVYDENGNYHIYYGFNAGETVFCDWFNFPNGSNAVVIYKHTCIETFDVYTADADGVASACQEYLDGVTFHVTDGGPTDASGASGEDGEGEVIFEGLGSGEYFINEEVPQGYDVPVVYCAM